MSARDKAIENFEKGFNCSQSVVLAFSHLFNQSEDHLLKIASPFGGGIGRMREVCGAVSGMVLVLGLLYGYSTPETGDKKAELYTAVQDLMKTFESRYDTVVCRDLLNLFEKHSSPIPTPRSSDFYHDRPCAKYIGEAATILEEYINSHPFKNL